MCEEFSERLDQIADDIAEEEWLAVNRYCRAALNTPRPEVESAKAAIIIAYIDHAYEDVATRYGAARAWIDFLVTERDRLAERLHELEAEAVPNLLSALKDIVHDADDRKGGVTYAICAREIVDKARAAIAKAEGRHD